MSCNFGFPAVCAPSEHTFVSYSRFDAERVAPIAKLINDDRPVWYDEGLVAGQEWEKMIIEQVKGCKAAAFFVSRDLLGRDKSYVCDEFRFATEHGKPALCVLLDDVSDLTPSDAMRDLWDGLQKLPAVSVYDKPTDTEKAQAVLAALDALERKAPAPSTDLPKSEPNPTPKAEPKPEGGFAKFLGSKLFKAAVAIPIAAALAVGGTVAARQFLKNDDTPVNDIPVIEEPESPRYVEDIESVDDVEIDDVLTMGEFEGKEIEWIVLDKKDDDVLLITKDVLCEKQFDDRYGSFSDETWNQEAYEIYSKNNEKRTELSSKITMVEHIFNIRWDNCSLRSWLNDDFASKSFKASELEFINYTNVITPDFILPSDPNVPLLVTYTFDGGNDTKDRIFLLSADEYENYFSSNSEYDWWLRSPGGIEDIITTERLDNEILVHDTIALAGQNSKYISEYWHNISDDYPDNYQFDDNVIGYSNYSWWNGSFFYRESGVRPAMWVHIGD